MSKLFCRNLHHLPPPCLVLSLWIGLAPPVHATLTPQLTLEDLTRAADAIVVATATHTENVWMEGELVTRVTLSVEQTLQGYTSHAIHLLVLGGIDVSRRIPVASVVPGQPRILHGERSLLFLRRLDQSSSEFGLVGDAQGRFVLLPNAVGNSVAVRDLSSVHLVTGEGVSQGPTTAVPMELLVEHLRTLLATESR